jgi:hypothetical protein
LRNSCDQLVKWGEYVISSEIEWEIFWRVFQIKFHLLFTVSVDSFETSTVNSLLVNTLEIAETTFYDMSKQLKSHTIHIHIDTFHEHVSWWIIPCHKCPIKGLFSCSFGITTYCLPRNSKKIHVWIYFLRNKN